MPLDRAWTTKQINSNLERILSPAVCMRALTIIRSEKVDFRQVAESLSPEPLLVAKALALANLQQGPAREPIRSMERAIQVLGLRSTQMMVMSAMLMAAMFTTKRAEQSRDLRRWVLGLGAANRWMDQRRDEPGRKTTPGNGKEPDLAMVRGLLMGLGPLILLAGLDVEYEDLLGTPPRLNDLRMREAATLGVTHDQIGWWALEALGCPPEAMGLKPLNVEGEAGSLDALESRAVEMLAASAAGIECGACEAWLPEALSRLGIDPSDLLEVHLPELRRGIVELAQVFSVEAEVEPMMIASRPLSLEMGLMVESLLIDKVMMEASLNDGLMQAATATLEKESVAEQSQLDPLTGVLNRRGAEETVRKLAEEPDQPLGLLLVDLDHFKEINDTAGHAAGDRVLEFVARTLRDASPDTAMVCRLGGDEFAALYRVPSAAALKSVADSIGATLRSGPAIGGRLTTSSIGGHLTSSAHIAREWSGLLARADLLLYEAKRQGRDNSVISGLDA